MKFETFRIPARGPKSATLADYFLASRPGKYDSVIARELCAISAWSYSEADTFSRMMTLRGFPESECVSISLANDALLVDNTALLIQTKDRRLAVLAFRGTQPTNAINWLANFSAKVEPYRQGGMVHGGFHHATLALSSPLGSLLESISQGESIGDAVIADQNKTVLRPQKAKMEEILLRYRTLKAIKERPEGKLEKSLQGELEKVFRSKSESEILDGPPLRLYLTGHSLGGALAVLAAARMHRGGTQYFDLAHRLAGIYTFGQPMVGNAAFADSCQRDFGDKVFRHVHARDIVPRMPPLTMGRFRHFGDEYKSTAYGWTKSDGVRPASMALTSTTIGFAAWIFKQVRFLDWVRLPYSMADHSPLNYLQASQAAAPGAEIEGE